MLGPNSSQQIKTHGLLLFWFGRCPRGWSKNTLEVNLRTSHFMHKWRMSWRKYAKTFNESVCYWKEIKVYENEITNTYWCFHPSLILVCMALMKRNRKDSCCGFSPPARFSALCKDNSISPPFPRGAFKTSICEVHFLDKCKLPFDSLQDKKTLTLPTKLFMTLT